MGSFGYPDEEMTVFRSRVGGAALPSSRGIEPNHAPVIRGKATAFSGSKYRPDPIGEKEDSPYFSNKPGLGQ